MHLKHRTTCRVCGNGNLIDVINFGEQYLSGSFVKDDIKPSIRKLPLVLTLCDVKKNESACGLLQLKHSVPTPILYNHYWYRSGTNATMRKHLADIASQIKEFNPASILDIGCNDGTLLKEFDNDVVKYGIDPSDAVNGLELPNLTVINETFPLTKGIDVCFDVITSIAMFYDLEFPMEFIKQVKTLLNPGGAWVFEVAYLPAMLSNNALDTVCHEHLEYYSLAVIEHMLDANYMKLVKAELTDTNCGSILCWAVSKSSDKVPDAEIQSIREAEFGMELEEPNTYYEFSRKIIDICNELNLFCKKAFAEKKTIHVYGASTKGNVLIQSAEIAQYISFAADRNPSKWGARTLGTDIPIISEEESRAMKPDYYLVLPWHFKTEFLEREKDAIARGTKFIFPLPKLEVIG